MRNIVEHGQISGSSDTTVLSGVSSSSRLHQVDLGADGDHGDPAGASFDGADDEVGGADLVGHLRTRRGCTRGGRPRCRRGARPGRRRRARGGSAGAPSSGPSTAGRWTSLHSASAEAAELEAGVPHPHVVVAVAHGACRCCGRGAGRGRTAPCRRRRWRPPTPCPPARPGPAPSRGWPGRWWRCRRRRRCAPTNAFEGGARVHVGDRDHPVDVDHGGERLPGLLDLVEVGHVGHRAAGVQVGEDHLLVVAGEDVGRLGHEVHAAEHDVLGLGPAPGPAPTAGSCRRGRRPSG